ncbi:MAG: glycosyltransferase [Solirubrobacteraceae bacterium]
MRIALVSREVHPLSGGGIGQFVAAAARLLSTIAEVTIVTTSQLEDEYRRLREGGDPRLPPERVRLLFVDEPTEEDLAVWTHVLQCYSSRVLERLREAYPDGGPDLIEFPDYHGEAFVTLQAAEALDPFLARTRVCVRVHTTSEICEVLDGWLRDDHASRALHAMERYCLARADRLIWQGGDVLGTYQRFYGAESLAPAVRVRYPYAGPTAGGQDDREFTASRPLRILYAGRLERRKGVHNLVRAVTGMERSDLRVTLLGQDTQTAPLGASMRQQLRLAIADDERLELHPARAHDAMAETIRDHDLVIVPSLWECWPYAALEALHLNRPVLATPVGGLAEIVAEGESGWLASGTAAEAIEEALLTVLEQPERLQELIRSRGPALRAGALCASEPILDAYRELAAAPPRWSSARRRSPTRLPLVSAIVPYFHASRYVRDTIESLAAQTYPRMELVLVNDGSFDEDDWIVAELAARFPLTVVSQMNQGLGAARNFGVRQSQGRYFFPLDADNLAEPEFVARGVEILERRSQVAYVTSWSRYIDGDGRPLASSDLGYEPLGNHAALNADTNVAGDAAAVLRRRVFDAGFRYDEELTSFEDWHLYRELQRAGMFGVVIPQRLLRYRVRADSLQARFAVPRRARLMAEIEARMRESEVRWTSSSA